MADGDKPMIGSSLDKYADLPGNSQKTKAEKEYEDKVLRYKPVFDHHYKYNRHHPEHYENCFEDMTLVDLVEMLCDWLGYKEYMTITEAMNICYQQMDRYHMSDDLRRILFNTLLRYFSLLGGFNDSLPALSADNIPQGILEEISPLPRTPYNNEPTQKGSIVNVVV